MCTDIDLSYVLSCLNIPVFQHWGGVSTSTLFQLISQCVINARGRLTVIFRLKHQDPLQVSNNFVATTIKIFNGVRATINSTDKGLACWESVVLSYCIKRYCAICIESWAFYLLTSEPSGSFRALFWWFIQLIGKALNSMLCKEKIHTYDRVINIFTLHAPAFLKQFAMYKKT